MTDRHTPVGREINLADKETILCSIYDDIEDAKALIVKGHEDKQTEILLSFEFSLSYVLSDLELELGVSIDNRYHVLSSSVNLGDISNVFSVLKDEVTNLRFLLRGRAQDTANKRLRELKKLAVMLPEKLRAVEEDVGVKEDLALKNDNGTALTLNKTPTKTARKQLQTEAESDFAPSEAAPTTSSSTSAVELDKDGDVAMNMANSPRLKVQIKRKTLAGIKTSFTPPKTITLSALPQKSHLGAVPKRGRKRNSGGKEIN